MERVVSDGLFCLSHWLVNRDISYWSCWCGQNFLKYSKIFRKKYLSIHLHMTTFSWNQEISGKISWNQKISWTHASKTKWNLHNGVATGVARGQSATPDNKKFAENREKIRKNPEEKAKIRKFLSLCPSWQIGLATLLNLKLSIFNFWILQQSNLLFLATPD